MKVLEQQLENDIVFLKPLHTDDFEVLFAIGRDKEIWVQHPKSNRYLRDEFLEYFKSLTSSVQAYLILDKDSNTVIGSTCYYDWDVQKKSIAIGFTFLIKKHWGGMYNSSIKNLMLHHAFHFVDTVIFHVGKNNFRSQKALEKIGAKMLLEDPDIESKEEISVIYKIEKQDFDLNI